MKAKFLILSLLLAGFAGSVSAQSRYYAESAKNNYFIGLGAGAQVVVNPDNSEYGLGKAITPIFEVNFGKLINPIWGVRFQAAGLNTTLYSYYTADGSLNAMKNRKYVTLRVDGLFNVSNAIAGYNPDRLFDVYAFGGPALAMAKAKFGTNDKVKALINGSVGLGGKFNVSKYVDINIEARGEAMQSPFGDESSAVTDGVVSLQAGLSYYFGGKKFVKVVNEELYLAANGDIQKYKELLAAEQADHNATKEALAKEKAKPAQIVEKVVETSFAGPRAVFFTIGSAKIDSKGKANIELAAQIMKENPSVKYEVVGYADKATGSAKTNQKVSDKRAKAVYEALVKAGVSENQISYRGVGGHENLWDSRTLTRVVIIEPVK